MATSILSKLKIFKKLYAKILLYFVYNIKEQKILKKHVTNSMYVLLQNNYLRSQAKIYITFHTDFSVFFVQPLILFFIELLLSSIFRRYLIIFWLVGIVDVDSLLKSFLLTCVWRHVS